MTRYIFIIIALVIVNLHTCYGQQDAQYTQYMYNTISVNPAYTGSRGIMSGLLLHRSQWLGLEGAPSTQTFNLHSPVGKNVGMGFSIVNDEIGNSTIQETSFDASFSYTIRTSEANDKLSFGLKAGGHLLNIDLSQLSGYVDEPIGMGSIDNKFSPNIGLGIYFHNDKFYVGLSAPNILETEHYDRSFGDANDSFVVTERINYYFISGYVFDVTSTIKFKPAILFKAVKGAPFQADLSANALLHEKVSLGLAYRWDAALSAMVGFQLSDRFTLGMAYDKEVTEFGNTAFNDGSFEVFLRYEFYGRSKRLLTPQIFLRYVL